MREQLSQVDAADIDRILLRDFGAIPTPLSRWVLVSNQGALSFALANDVSSDGGFSRAPLAHPLLGDNPTFRFSFPPHMHLINHGYSVGWRQIATDPGAWMHVVKRKLQRFADGATQGFTALNFPIGRQGVREPIDMFTARSAFDAGWRIVLLATFGAGAVIAALRRVAGVWLLIIAYKIVVTILFYGYARQAASIAPAFLVLTALVLDGLMTRLSPAAGPSVSVRWVMAGFALIIALGIEVFAAVTADRFTPHGNLNLRTDWGPSAFQSYERAVIRYSPPPLE
jgi:hypothetical protein